MSVLTPDFNMSWPQILGCFEYPKPQTLGHERKAGRDSRLLAFEAKHLSG